MTGSQRKLLMQLNCLMLILLFGLRYKVGIDTYNYMSQFDTMPDIMGLATYDYDSDRLEPGYIWVCALARSTINEFWMVQIIMAAITNIGMFIFLYRECKNPFWGVICYYILAALYFNCEIIRESAAIGIFLINYKNLKEGKLLKFYLFSLFSIAFHYSAMIIWIFPLAKYLKLNWIYVAACVAILFVTPLFEDLNKLITLQSINKRVDMYVDAADYLNTNWKIVNFVKNAIPPIGLLIAWKLFKINPRIKSFILLQILFTIGALGLPDIFERLTNYTNSFVIIGYATLLGDKRIYLYLRSWLFIFLFLTQSYTFYTRWFYWNPYVSVFHPEEIEERHNKWIEEFGGW